MDAFYSLVLGRSIERGISNSVTIISSVTMFVIAYFNHSDLTHAKIFSILITMITLKTLMMYLDLGVGLESYK